jgi:hypothetical protein
VPSSKSNVSCVAGSEGGGLFITICTWSSLSGTYVGAVIVARGCKERAAIESPNRRTATQLGLCVVSMRRNLLGLRRELLS